MNQAAMKEKLAELEAENARLKAEADRPIKFKVATKGGLSLYGLGRFPVTLYAEQWEKLLGSTAQIREALKRHESELKRKS
jgi:hypothetical protein